ncbi:helix-turn-helix domain-containing protein [Modestobacter sp. SYSU DS0875]
MTASTLPGLLRRIRRTGDLSQRELAEHLGVSKSAIAAVECGARGLDARVLERAAELAGLRLVLLDEQGREAPGMTDAAVRDGAGRLFPAHLDTRHGDEDWWGGEHLPRATPPRYTFSRERRYRDGRRRLSGTAGDHHRPEPGDSLPDRARARAQAAARRAAEERRRRFLAGERPPPSPDPVCTCPPGCDVLLVAGERWPHVEDCPCRCDLG